MHVLQTGAHGQYVYAKFQCQALLCQVSMSGLILVTVLVPPQHVSGPVASHSRRVFPTVAQEWWSPMRLCQDSHAQLAVQGLCGRSEHVRYFSARALTPALPKCQFPPICSFYTYLAHTITTLSWIFPKTATFQYSAVASVMSYMPQLSS